jgi:hypothetical protein
MLPTIPDWIQAGAAVVQALSAAALVALTLLTLLVLRQYAAETGQIAKDSSSQVGNAIAIKPTSAYQNESSGVLIPITL